MDDVIVAVDPGRVKSGFALVTSSGRVLHKGIVATADIATAVAQFVSLRNAAAFVVGDGTAAPDVQKRLSAAGVPNEKLFEVDETRSSEIGRREYWRENPPTGWRRLIPVGLQVPPEPYDDFAAVVLARRFLTQEAGDTARN